MKVLKNMLLLPLAFLLVAALVVASFGYQADRTVLNADFVTHELERVDAVGLATDWWVAQLPAGPRDYAPAFGATAKELKPWAQKRVREFVRAGLAYLKGDAAGLAVEIDTATVRASLDRNLREQLRTNPPPDIARLPRDQQPAAAEKLHDAIMAELALPDVYRLDLATLRPEQREDLQDLRQIMGWSYALYYGAIWAAVGLGLLIFWLGSLRWIAGVLMVYGAGVYLLSVFSEGPAVTWLLDELFELPSPVQTNLPELYVNLVSPLAQIGLGGAVAGLALLALAWLAKRTTRPSASSSSGN